MIDRKVLLIGNVFSDFEHILDIAESHSLNREEFLFVLNLRDRYTNYKKDTMISIREKRQLEQMNKRLWRQNNEALP